MAPKARPVFSARDRKAHSQGHNATEVLVGEQGRIATSREETVGIRTRLDNTSIKEKDGTDLRSHESTTQNLKKYSKANGELDEAQTRSRANSKLEQVEKHAEDTGVKEDLHVWVRNEKDDTQGKRAAKIWKDEGASRGVSVTVGSLRKFLASGSGKKSLFSTIAAVMVALDSKPTWASDNPLVPTPRDLIDMKDTPGLGEALLLLDAAKAIYDIDNTLAPGTAKKTMEMAIATQGLEQVVGLPLLINKQTKELFGVPDSIWAEDGLPKDLILLGTLDQATLFGNVLITKDLLVGFDRTSKGSWEMKVRQPNGEFRAVSK